MSSIIIKERPDLIYCHRCDTNATYIIGHSSSADRLSGDTFELNAWLSVYCQSCMKEILSVSASATSDKLDREI